MAGGVVQRVEKILFPHNEVDKKRLTFGKMNVSNVGQGKMLVNNLIVASVSVERFFNLF